MTIKDFKYIFSRGLLFVTSLKIFLLNNFSVAFSNIDIVKEINNTEEMSLSWSYIRLPSINRFFSDYSMHLYPKHTKQEALTTTCMLQTHLIIMVIDRNMPIHILLLNTK